MISSKNLLLTTHNTRNRYMYQCSYVSRTNDNFQSLRNKINVP